MHAKLQELLVQLQCVVVSIVKIARRLLGENSVEVLYFAGQGLTVSCEVADGSVSGQVMEKEGMESESEKVASSL